MKSLRGAAAGDDAGLQRRQLHEAAAVERQLRDLPRGHDAAGGRRAERHVARFTGDRDLFLDAADLHLDVDEQVLADGDGQLVADDWPEALQLRCHLVRSGRQAQYAVPTVLVRDLTSFRSRLNLLHQNRDTGEHGFLLVSDGSGNAACGVLGDRHRRKQADKSSENGETLHETHLLSSSSESSLLLEVAAADWPLAPPRAGPNGSTFSGRE